MAGSVNKVILVGRLGKDPVIRSMGSGDRVASFGLATSETWRDKATGERKEKTEWHNVVIFNENLVKVAESYLKKGTNIYIEGALQTRKWTDQQGIEKYSTEIVLKNFNGTLTMLDSRATGEARGDNQDQDDSGGRSTYGADSSQSSGAAQREQQRQARTSTVIDDDIPF